VGVYCALMDHATLKLGARPDPNPSPEEEGLLACTMFEDQTMPSLSPEQIAMLNYRYNRLAEFLDKGSEIDPLTYRTPDSDTVLHMATLANDAEAVSWLLHAGSDPNAIGDMGQTALHLAADNNNNEIVSLLIAFGAKTDIVDEFGQTPDLSAIGQ
jgi:ankyrin repeat protein